MSLSSTIGQTNADLNLAGSGEAYGSNHVAHDDRVDVAKRQFRAIVARTTTAPRSGAGVSLSVPQFVPIAVPTGE
jgi:hypothetical protein